MKRLTFLILFISSISLFAVDITGELENNLILKDFQNEDIYTKAKLSFKSTDMDYLTKVVLYGDDITNEISIYKSFLEYYNKNSTIAIGKQKISWGSGYLFNLSNSNFIMPNPEDPKGESEGTSSLSLKYNIGDLSRLEGLVYKNKNIKQINYAMRYTTLISNWEFMANFFEKDNQFILETKGNVGIGLWSQLDFKNENMVLGLDYSYEIFNRVLYLMNENFYIKEQEKMASYFKYDYQWNELLTFSQSLIYFPSEAGFFSSNSIKYLFNNYIDLNFKYNRISNINSKTIPIPIESIATDEVKIIIKTYF